MAIIPWQQVSFGGAAATPCWAGDMDAADHVSWVELNSQQLGQVLSYNCAAVSTALMFVDHSVGEGKLIHGGVSAQQICQQTLSTSVVAIANFPQNKSRSGDRKLRDFRAFIEDDFLDSNIGD